MARSRIGKTVARRVPGGKALVAGGRGTSVLARFAWRHRKRLAPLYLWLGILAFGLALHGWVPGVWPAPLATGLGSALAVWFLGARLSEPLREVVTFLVPDSMDDGRRGVLDRPTERAYLAVLLANAGGWLALLAHHGGTADVVLVGGLAFVGLGTPWWWHRRIRRTGRLNRFARLWPKVAQEVRGFADSHVTPEGVRNVGGRGKTVVLTVSLRGGKTVEDVGGYAGNVASVFNLRGGAVTVAPGRTARQVQVRIVPRDPWAAKITHPLFEQPHLAHGLRLADSDRFAMGLLDDGDQLVYSLFHTLVFGQSGSGKSSFIESLLVWLLSCEDVVCVGSDMAGGATLGVWEPLFVAPIATDVDSSLELIQRLRELIGDRLDILAEIKRRAEGAADDVLPPSAEFPAVVAFFDEWPTLVAEGSADVVKVMGVMAKQGRKVNVWFVLASQNATKADVGATELRGQLRSLVGFRLDSQQNKNAWKEKVNQGWSSVDLPIGVYLLSDDEHMIPRQSKGFFVRKDQRAEFIKARTGNGPGLDRRGAAILAGDALPVIDSEVIEAEIVETEPRRLRVGGMVAAAIPVPRPKPSRSATVAELVAAELVAAEQPLSPAELAATLGRPVSSVDKALRRLVGDGAAVKVGHGRYSNGE